MERYVILLFYIYININYMIATYIAISLGKVKDNE